MSETKPADQTLPRLLLTGSEPVIYFDAAPTYGFNDGVANITLDFLTNVLNDKGQVERGRKVVAYLRTGMTGLLALKSAVDSAILMATPASGEGAEKKAH